MSAKTIFIALNELNFDFIREYSLQGHLPHFKMLLDKYPLIVTESEKEYELLEPWIQWVTVHTGKTYDEHKIFRLGDIVEHQNLSQLFEELESAGKSVGAISPFNADNRLKNASFFVPDPWTKTKVSGNWFIKSFYEAIHQAVNDNAQNKITLGSLTALAFAFLFFVPITKWGAYIGNVLNRKKPGMKAIVLDNLLSDVFYALWKRKKPDYAHLFLNSGAHIQHHYLFNSTAYKGKLKNPEWYCPKDWDPLIYVLKSYDALIGKFLKHDGIKICIATGLHQQAHEKITYYWRLKDHSTFLNEINVKGISQILPRMSRDFLVEFDSNELAKEGAEILRSFIMESTKVLIFNVDNRGSSLFVELVYPHEITQEDVVYSTLTNQKVNGFKNYIAFVAIKNGEHNGQGYFLSNNGVPKNKTIQLSELKGIIKEHVLT